MVEGKTREETVRLTAEALGISTSEAEFIVAMELGEINGDVVVVDDNGRVVRPVIESRDVQAENEADPR
jgi:hypothetical protein